MMKIERGAILSAIDREREQQDQTWGEQNHHPDRWMTILGEEYGEACKHSLEDDVVKYAEELIQVAAVAVAAIESLYRGKWGYEKETGNTDRGDSDRVDGDCGGEDDRGGTAGVREAESNG